MENYVEPPCRIVARLLVKDHKLLVSAWTILQNRYSFRGDFRVYPQAGQVLFTIPNNYPDVAAKVIHFFEEYRLLSRSSKLLDCQQLNFSITAFNAPSEGFLELCRARLGAHKNRTSKRC